MNGKSEPPLPIAALLLRARNAKGAKERHDLAYFGWEASVRLAVAADPPRDRSGLSLPSASLWVAAMQASKRELDDPALLAARDHILWVALERRSKAPRTTIDRLMEGLGTYRNKVIAHSAVRYESFYEHASHVLTAGLEALWRQAAL